MTADEIFEAFVDDFKRRKFVGGLLVALIDFLLDLNLPESDVDSFDDLVEAFPKQELTSTGTKANTLIVERNDGSTLSIRPFYNDVETFFRAEKHRHDFPSCAPHATQAWSDYIDWIDSLCDMDESELLELRERAVDHVLGELPSREVDPSSIEVDPPTFRLLLEEFDFKAPNDEPTGAAFQGAAFGFIRADNPHLQVEIDKVRTGSSRLQRVGDIDAWDGERLAVSAEVKFTAFEAGDIDGITGFIGKVNRRGAIGMVIAYDMTDKARVELADAGVKPLTVEDLIAIVELWDPAKQRIAVKSFVYYAEHVEQKSVLATRLHAFLDDIEESRPAAPAPEAVAEEVPGARPA